MLDDNQLRDVAREVFDRFEQFFSSREGLYAYRCINEVQDVSRLTMHMNGLEVQINAIKHSKVKHHHLTDMTSVILDGGYTWFLQQQGATSPIEMHAAPGSIIRMGPNDEHWIPETSKPPSISMCVFENQTYWHQHYTTLNDLSAGVIIGRAIGGLKRFIDRQQFDWQ